MNPILKTFATDDSGAVTVDWVVLTAALVFFGIAVAATVADGTMNSAQELGENLGSGTIGL